MTRIMNLLRSGILEGPALSGKSSTRTISTRSLQHPIINAPRRTEKKATLIVRHIASKSASNSYRFALRHRFATSLATNSFDWPCQDQTSYDTHPATTAEPIIHDVFEPATGTWQYVIADTSTSKAVIIDPVLDYNPANRTITTNTADGLLSLVRDKRYTIEKILETHAHADHLTAAAYLQTQLAQAQGFKPAIGIGKRIQQVQKLFGQRYGIPEAEWSNAFDILFDDDEVFHIGELKATALHLPGHTPDHLGYRIGDNVFCGDSLFHADIGTARCDFPGGDAAHLFNSGRRLLALDDHVRIWPGHDYPPAARTRPVSWLSVREHRMQNKHLRDVVSEEEFVQLRTERDASLEEPRLLHQSLQVNIRAGRLPRVEESGYRLLHLPLKLNGLEW